MYGAHLIEQREREPYDLIGVFGVIAATLREFQRAPATYVRDAVDLHDLAAIAPDVVEHQPFAQRQVAEGQFFGTETAKNRVEQHRSGHDQVRAPRVEARNRKSTLEVEFGDLFSDPADLLCGDMKVPQFRWRSPTGGGCRNRANAQNRARSADHTVETRREDLFAIAIDLGVHVLDDLSLVAVRERVAANEPLREANRANLEAASQLDGARRSERNLDAATTDVDDDGAPAGYVNAVYRGLMNETRFFGS